MVTKVYCSLDYSRLGVEVYEPKNKKRKIGKTLFHKITKGGEVRWIHVHTPSREYIQARENFLKKFSTGCVGLSMGEWIMKKRREQEKHENRCSILLARVIRYVEYQHTLNISKKG